MTVAATVMAAEQQLLFVAGDRRAQGDSEDFFVQKNLW